MKTSLRGRLKSDTAIEHKKIDDLYSKLNLSIFNDYKIFLTAHYIALSSIEGSLKNDFNKTALPPCQTDLIANDLLSLDLSLSTTRAVSPIHLEYLKNMGVGASMSISIIVRGKLWGLFACHNNSPKHIGYGMRSMSELFAQMFSYVLDQKENDERSAEAVQGQIIHDQIMAQLADGNTVTENFETIADAISSVIPYDGLAVWANEDYLTRGDTPKRSEFLEIIPFLNTTAQVQFILYKI